MVKPAVPFNRVAAFVSYAFRYRMTLKADNIWTFIYYPYCIWQILTAKDLYKINTTWYKIIYWDGKSSWSMMPLFKPTGNICIGCFKLESNGADSF